MLWPDTLRQTIEIEHHIVRAPASARLINEFMKEKKKRSMRKR